MTSESVFSFALSSLMFPLCSAPDRPAGQLSSTIPFSYAIFVLEITDHELKPLQPRTKKITFPPLNCVCQIFCPSKGKVTDILALYVGCVVVYALESHTAEKMIIPSLLKAGNGQPHHQGRANALYKHVLLEWELLLSAVKMSRFIIAFLGFAAM